MKTRHLLMIKWLLSERKFYLTQWEMDFIINLPTMSVFTDKQEDKLEEIYGKNRFVSKNQIYQLEYMYGF